MIYPDPHSFDQTHIMAACEDIAEFISMSAWAVAQGNTDPADNPAAFEGLSRVAGWVAHLLSESQQHATRQCKCFAGGE